MYILCSVIVAACTQIPHAKAPEEVNLSEADLRLSAAEREQLLDLLDRNDSSLAFYRNPATRDLVIRFFEELTDSGRIAGSILRYADKYDVSPILAFSVAYVESDFNPKAFNRNPGSVDRGLFQLNSLSFPFLKDKDFYDPEISANYGVSYLKILLEEGKNDIVAIAMYNAGRQRVTASGAPVMTLEYISKYVDYRRKVEDSFRMCLHDALKEGVPSKAKNSSITFLDIRKRKK